MTVKEEVESAIKEALLPELSALRKVFSETKNIFGINDRDPGGSNKRLDDLLAHLMDQSRRIDALSRRIEKIQAGLSSRLDETIIRLNRPYKDNVRRDEYGHLAARVRRLELEVEELKRRVGI